MFSDNDIFKECCGVGKSHGINIFPCDLCIHDPEKHEFVCAVDIPDINNFKNMDFFKGVLREINVFDKAYSENVGYVGSLVVTRYYTWGNSAIIECFSDFNDFGKLEHLCIRKTPQLLVSSDSDSSNYVIFFK